MAGGDGGGFSFGDFASGLDTGGMFGGLAGGDFSPRISFDGGSAAPNVGDTQTPDMGSGFSFGKLAGGFGDFAKSVLPLLGLGLGGLNVAQSFKGGQQMGDMNKLVTRAANREDQIAGQQQEVARPLASFSATTLADAQAGKIPPAIQARVDQWKQAAMQQVRDFAARTGQSESTQMQNWLMWIDEQAKAMEAQWLEQAIGSGIQAGSAAGNVLGQAAQASAQESAQAHTQADAIGNLIGQANAALAKLNAST